jgi:hypothetical protein
LEILGRFGASERRFLQQFQCAAVIPLFFRNNGISQNNRGICNSTQIPLLFRCSEKQRFGCKPLKLLARRRAMAAGFFKNSLLIPL